MTSAKMIFSKNVVRLRRQRGITQVQLAEATGISEITISLIERGKGNPSLDTVERIAQGLNTKPYILLIDN